MNFLRHLLPILIITFFSCSSEKKIDDKVTQQDIPEMPNKTIKDTINCISVVKNYFNLINQSKYEDASKFFSDKVIQFISIKNTNPKLIFQLTSQFLKNKSPIKYTVFDSTFTCKNNIANFILNMEWGIPVSDEWKNSNGYTNGAERIRSADVKIEVIFNDKNKIISYKEIQIFRKKFKTLVEMEVYPSLDFEKMETFKLPKNSVITDDFEKLSLMSSISFSVLHKVLYNGKSYWITESDSYRSSSINNGGIPTVNKLLEEIKSAKN